MGKQSRERTLPSNEAKAVSRSLRVSPQKLNLVAGMIRGKKVEQALYDLEFSRKRIAQDVRKCVMSAVANAENNHQLDANQLVVAEAYVGKNLVMKRFKARARGRASMIMKPFSQITVIVREVDEDETEAKPKTKKKVAKKAAAKKTPAKKKAATKETGQGDKKTAKSEKAEDKPAAKKTATKKAAPKKAAAKKATPEKSATKSAKPAKKETE